jgi:hypothetical protein
MRIEHMSFHIPAASKSIKVIAFLLCVQSFQNQQKE